MFYVTLLLPALAVPSETQPLAVIPVVSGELLKQMQPPKPACYQQKGDVLAQLKTFNPGFFDRNDVKRALESSDLACLCENWWPETGPKYTQMIWSISGDRVVGSEMEDNNKCLRKSSMNIKDCTSFESDHSCKTFLWISANNRPNPNPESFENEATLRCSTDLNGEQPVWPVFIYEIDAFDIGERCDRDAIMKILNTRQELYRKGSQFYYQIPIFKLKELIENNCDPRILSEGIALRLFFRCRETLPLLREMDFHLRPQSRGVETIVSAVQRWSPAIPRRYWLAGAPWSRFQLQSINRQPTADDPLCVSEQNDILVKTDSRKCPAYESHLCHKSECEVRLNFHSRNAQIWCSQTRSEPNPPTLFGTKYFPNALIRITKLSLAGGTTYAGDGGLQSDWAQKGVCGGDPAKERERWAQLLNDRIFTNRYNSELHMSISFHVNAFTYKVCPDAHDKLKQQLFLADKRSTEFEVVLQVACDSVSPPIEW